MKLQGDENKKNIRNTLKSSTFSFLRVKENLILSAEKKRKNNLGCYAPTHSSKDLEQRILEIECSCSCSVIQHCIFSRDLHTQHYVFSKNKALQILRKKGFPALKESRPDHALGFVYRGPYFLEKSASLSSFFEKHHISPEAVLRIRPDPRGRISTKNSKKMSSFLNGSSSFRIKISKK